MNDIMQSSSNDRLTNILSRIPKPMYYEQLDDRVKVQMYYNWLIKNTAQPELTGISDDQLIRGITGFHMRLIGMKLVNVDILLLYSINNITRDDLFADTPALLGKVIAENKGQFDIDTAELVLSQLMTKMPRDLSIMLTPRQKRQLQLLIILAIQGSQQLSTMINPSMNCDKIKANAMAYGIETFVSNSEIANHGIISTGIIEKFEDKEMDDLYKSLAQKAFNNKMSNNEIRKYSNNLLGNSNKGDQWNPAYNNSTTGSGGTSQYIASTTDGKNNNRIVSNNYESNKFIAMDNINANKINRLSTDVIQNDRLPGLYTQLSRTYSVGSNIVDEAKNYKKADDINHYANANYVDTNPVIMRDITTDKYYYYDTMSKTLSELAPDSTNSGSSVVQIKADDIENLLKKMEVSQDDISKAMEVVLTNKGVPATINDIAPSNSVTNSRKIKTKPYRVVSGDELETAIKNIKSSGCQSTTAPTATPTQSKSVETFTSTATELTYAEENLLEKLKKNNSVVEKGALGLILFTIIVILIIMSVHNYKN